MTPEALAALAIAALGGAAVGVERQAAGQTTGPTARLAGIRTFTLLGLLGGIAGLLAARGALLPSAALLAGATGFVVTAYAASRTRIDRPTAVAALVALVAGTLSGLGEWAVGSGVATVTALVLLEQPRRAAVRRLEDDVRAGVRVAVMLLVLPLLPTGPIGPGAGVRPRELWALMLVLSGLGFVGHLARRVLGSRHGLLVAGLLGGLVSPTNVTWTFARQSRHETGVARLLAAGTLAANFVVVPRTVIVATVLDASLGWSVMPWLVPAAIVAALATWWSSRASPATIAEGAAKGDPLQLAGALQMVAVFQVVLWGVDLAGRLSGASGSIASPAVLGLTDIDALTATMAHGVGADGHAVAARGLVVGLTTNTLLKMGLAIVVGHPTFKRVAGLGLLAMAGALGAQLLWWR